MTNEHLDLIRSTALATGLVLSIPYVVVLWHLRKANEENAQLWKTTRTLYRALSSVYARLQKGEGAAALTEEEMKALDPLAESRKNVKKYGKRTEL